MTLMLHAGANPVEYAELRNLPVPAATPTHVPIPHFRLVDLIAHSLAYHGHEVVEQHFGVTPDGLRFFGVLCLKSPYTGYQDTCGLRNSHDKKFLVGISFGSRTFVCDNLAFSGDHVIKRKHTANLKRDLPGLIGEVVEPIAEQRERQKRTFDLYQATALTDQRADHAIMEMFRRDVIGVQKIADVHEQWQNPAHDWGLGPLDAAARHDLLESLEARYGRRSTIVTSQLPIDKWHDIIADPTYADAILDRLLHTAHRIELAGDSLRGRRT